MENNSKYIGIGTNKTILEIYKMMKEGSLVLQPSFQRKLVWNNKHKENFLETVLLNYPFPEVYFADGELNLETMEAKTLVVDGQQRLNTIYQYISDDSSLKLKRIPRYTDLPQDKKEDFLYYTVVVRDLKKRSLEEIKEIFSRINSVQYALNAMELNNALYEGEFITTAKKILASNILFEEVLSESEISRMRDLEFVTTIMATIEIGGYFNSTREVEGFIQMYEDEYPNAERMEKAFNEVLKYITELKIPLDSMWLKKTCMFTLISELLFWILRDQKALPDKIICLNVLNNIENLVMNATGIEEGDKYQEFYNYIYQGTASRKGRITRGELLSEELLKA